LHMASGSAVCFARGLNDAPKIAAILLVAQMASVPGTLLLVAAAMLLGGWLHSQKIARTMGHNITTLEPKNACVANVCTSALVLSASVFGLPLSTTHVSIGAISGLMLGQVSTGKSALKPIVLAWCATLPCAALLAALAYTALQLF
jgi:inorganic phosphate transporter, PiT family